MNNLLRALFSHARDKDVLMLRLGLAAVLLYAGIRILIEPLNWLGFVPQWVEVMMPREVFLKSHGFFEIGLGIGILAGVWLPLLAAIALLDFLSILIFFGIDDITFRDIGLVFMALALFLRTLPRSANEK